MGRVHVESNSRSKSRRKELSKHLRPKIIREWAQEYGSSRLKEQIVQGYEGWPLYLHERLAYDFPGAKLDKKAWDYDMVLNPTEEELQITRSFADRILELGLADDLESAFSRIKLRAYDVDEEYPAMGGTEIITREVHCIVFNNYRPGGSSNAFSSKTIRIDLLRS
jgi:hypothetical protein